MSYCSFCEGHFTYFSIHELLHLATSGALPWVGPLALPHSRDSTYQSVRRCKTAASYKASSTSYGAIKFVVGRKPKIPIFSRLEISAYLALFQTELAETFEECVQREGLFPLSAQFEPDCPNLCTERFIIEGSNPGGSIFLFKIYTSKCFGPTLFYPQIPKIIMLLRLEQALKRYSTVYENTLHNYHPTAFHTEVASSALLSPRPSTSAYHSDNARLWVHCCKTRVASTASVMSYQDVKL